MTTTATDQEEELLIISDESETTDDIELTLEEDSGSENDILSFDDEISDSDTGLDLGALKVEPETEISDEGELNLDFDLGGEESKMTVEDMLGDKESAVEEKIEITTQEAELKIDDGKQEADTFDFGLEDEIFQEEITPVESKADEIEGENNGVEQNVELENGFDISLDETVTDETIVEDDVLATTSDDSSIGGDDSTTGDDDVNAILNATIAKLIARKDNINAIKEKTTASIAKLNDEIKSLQGDVKAHKGEVKEFDKENAKITENIESLEKMKMK